MVDPKMKVAVVGLVFESTEYPGATVEICVSIHSPERINPGGNEHTLTTLVKVVSGWRL